MSAKRARPVFESTHIASPYHIVLRDEISVSNHQEATGGVTFPEIGFVASCADNSTKGSECDSPTNEAITRR